MLLTYDPQSSPNILWLYCMHFLIHIERKGVGNLHIRMSELPFELL